MSNNASSFLLFLFSCMVCGLLCVSLMAAGHIAIALILIAPGSVACGMILEAHSNDDE